MVIRLLLAVGLLIVVAACSASAPTAQGDSSETAAKPAPTAFAWPAALAPFGDGYPTAGDPCRQLGESQLTINLLDDSAMLVGCPGAATDAAAAALVAMGGKTVGEAQGVTLISMPQGDANAGMAGSPSAAK